MREIRRAIHFDFHTPPAIYDLNRDFDAAVFAQRLKDAHVDYINFFAHCNRGFAYYPSKVATRYPYLKGDMFGDIVRECHKRDIGVTGYLNFGIDHEPLINHPEWRQRDGQGRILFDPENNRHGCFRPCFNNDGYREYLLAVVREILEIGADGVFCDCIAPNACYCEHCVAEYEKLGIRLGDEEAMTRFSYDRITDLCRQVKEMVGPDRYLYLNGLPYYEFNNMDTHSEVECLPSSHWGYDYFWPNASYSRNAQKLRLYMTGRFQAGWGDHGGYKGKVSLENDVYDALCMNFFPSVGDHLHPATNVVKKIYEDIGEIYAWVMPYEKYTVPAQYKADIAVLTNYPGRLGKEYYGVARILGELQLGFEILHTDMDFSPFRLVILPEGVLVDDALKVKLESFLKKGGKILSAGTGGLKATSELERFNRTGAPLEPDWEKTAFALDEYAIIYKGKDPSNATYFNFVNLPENSADMSWATYSDGIIMQAENEADVRAKYVKPYYNNGWDGQRYFYYAPPEKETGDAAAAITGPVAHISFNIFTAYNKTAMKEHKLLVKQLIDELTPDPLVEVISGFPSTGRVTLTGTDDYTLMHVKVTFPEPRGEFHIVEEHVTLKAGAQLKLRGEYQSVSLLPAETPIESRIENGHTIVTLPEITGYSMFLCR